MPTSWQGFGKVLARPWQGFGKAVARFWQGRPGKVLARPWQGFGKAFFFWQGFGKVLVSWGLISRCSHNIISDFSLSNRPRFVRTNKRTSDRTNYPMMAAPKNPYVNKSNLSTSSSTLYTNLLLRALPLAIVIWDSFQLSSHVKNWRGENLEEYIVCGLGAAPSCQTDTLFTAPPTPPLIAAAAAASAKRSHTPIRRNEGGRERGVAHTNNQTDQGKTFQ